MQAWDVILDHKVIDTVYYDSDCSSDYVLRGLIDHDDYHPAIKVQERKRK